MKLKFIDDIQSFKKANLKALCLLSLNNKIQVFAYLFIGKDINLITIPTM